MCPNTYVGGGYQCHPIFIEIEHPINLNYTCQAYNVQLPSSPSAYASTVENCSLLSSESKDYGGRRVSKYVYAIRVPQGSDCHSRGESGKAKIIFSVSPPLRGWHNQGSGSDTAPFTKYDSSNPSCSIKCKARRGSKTDSDEFSFEASSNPDPSDHLGIQSSMRRQLIIETSSDGGVSVRFAR